MENYSSQIKLPPHGSLGHPPVFDRRPWFRSPRFIIFVTVFLVGTAISLSYLYSRPPIYRCSATVLTTEMTAIDRDSSVADIQHVAIQKQILLGEDIIAEILSRLKASSARAIPPQISLADIRRLLDAVPVPETNLVEIRAEGSDVELLRLLIDIWIDVYFDARAEEVKKLTDNTTSIIEGELKGLADRMHAARAELELFRKKNDILSAGREENETLARLNGLTQSLNKALDDEIRAKANLDAVKTAIANHETVVPDEDLSSLQNLEKRLQELREKLAEFDKRFTRDYLNLQPALKVIPTQIEKLEAEIRLKRRDGKKIVLIEAEKNYAAAQQTVREIRARLQEHKDQAAKFTAKFAEYETKKTDLDGLEKLYRETKERLVQIETSHKEKYPQVTVSNGAYLSNEPVRPNYSRDAILAIAGALLLALFCVGIVDYLTPRPEPQSPVVLSGIHMYPQAAGAIDFQQTRGKSLEQPQNKSLASPFYRELTTEELKELLNASSLKGKQLIGLLLSGLTLEEAASLQADQIDSEKGIIALAHSSHRTLHLNRPLKSLFTQSGGNPVWITESNRSTEDLAACLLCAALDLGVDPLEFSAEAIRHSYILYLVRQGLRLSALEEIVGYIEPLAISEYSTYAPAQKGRSIDAIELLHPALAYAEFSE
jgi:succinoglycan biosynthesis transport protein ExoP